MEIPLWAIFLFLVVVPLTVAITMSVFNSKYGSRTRQLSPRFWTTLIIFVETMAVLGYLLFFHSKELKEKYDIQMFMLVLISTYFGLIILLDVIYWNKNYFFSDFFIIR